MSIMMKERMDSQGRESRTDVEVQIVDQSQMGVRSIGCHEGHLREEGGV